MALLCAAAANTYAVSWTVEKDGSGDFQAIQEAVEAAASGDTIQIGPGRFEDRQFFQLPGGTAEAHVYTNHGQLTILGAGRYQTIIGPPTGPGMQNSFMGILSGTSSRLHVSDLAIENCDEGIEHSGPYLSVANFRSFQNFTGVESWAWTGTWVRDSEFIDSQGNGVLVFQGLGAKDVLIENCEFVGGITGIDLQSDSNMVRDCLFDGTRVGLQFSFGATGVVERCRFLNNGNWCLGMLSASEMELNDSFLGQSPGNIAVWSGSTLTGSGNVLEGGTVYSIHMTTSAMIDFHDNHILNAGGWSAYVATASQLPVEFDLRDNYWGTADSQQIAEWIRDGNDDAENTTVLFEPFHAEPVPTEKTSLGRLKSLFEQEP